ncbi:MAG: signal peptidase I [Thermoproteota archaeon]
MHRSHIPLFIQYTVLLSILLAISNFFAIVIVLTGSMEPTVPRGSLVVVAKFGDFHVGDIVLYRAFNTLILHRVVEERDGMFKTKGDAAQSWDPWLVPREAVVGKAVSVIPFLGYTLSILRKPITFAATITLVYIISSLIYMRKDLIEVLKGSCRKKIAEPVIT